MLVSHMMSYTTRTKGYNHLESLISILRAELVVINYRTCITWAAVLD